MYLRLCEKQFTSSTDSLMCEIWFRHQAGSRFRENSSRCVILSLCICNFATIVRGLRAPVHGSARQRPTHCLVRLCQPACEPVRIYHVAHSSSFSSVGGRVASLYKGGASSATGNSSSGSSGFSFSRAFLRACCSFSCWHWFFNFLILATMSAFHSDPTASSTKPVYVNVMVNTHPTYK